MEDNIPINVWRLNPNDSSNVLQNAKAERHIFPEEPGIEIQPDLDLTFWGVLQILAFKRVKYASAIYLLYAFILRVFLVPAWVLSLGVILPAASMKSIGTEMDAAASELQLSEVPGSNGDAPQFTIGDDDTDAGTPNTPPAEAFSPTAAESTSPQP